MEFEPFDKICRLKRTVVITEKIDGTNAQIFIAETGELLAGSRNRYVTVENDNYGFARWVKDNEDELRKLGPGRHFGEWWGQGIQRRYGLTEKRFSLFNSSRWTNNPERPACCHVVPILAAANLDTGLIDDMLTMLRERGSVAAPGFMEPEGIVVFHSASQTMSKVTLGNDGHKGESAKTKEKE